MEEHPRVLYHGPAAAELAEQWGGEDRPFVLEPVSDDAVASLEATAVDCLVCAGGSAADVVGTVRDAHTHLPIVVFGSEDDDLDAATALERGVTHYVHAGDEAPVDLLESVEPVVERYRRERRERTMLDSLLDNIPLSVYFKDREGRFLRVSDAMTSMMGDPYLESPDGVRYHTPEDVVGTTDFDLFPDDLAESAVEDDRSVVESEEPVDRIEHAYGPEFDGGYVATSKAPWYDTHGNVVGTVGVTRDISERKRYEHKLERQNERLERFAGVISHDLRNPLEVARGRLEFAREDGDAEHFDAIERSLARMDQLIDDVLTVSRYGEAVEDPQAVDLATAARDAWDVVDSGDATLDVEAEVVLRADPGRLSQLLENLFRNSVEHGGVGDDLVVTVGDLPLRSGFYVADNGVGIPEEDRDAVFDTGFSTGDEGTGLGLDIVRSIADAHGWNVDVCESDAGGARFELKNVWNSGE